MRQLELDEPLAAGAPPKSMVAVPSPAGDEIAGPRELEEPTRLMTREQLELLLAEDRRAGEEDALRRLLAQGLHARPTVRSTQAVNPLPSGRRPEPVVGAVDGQGSRVDP